MNTLITNLSLGHVSFSPTVMRAVASWNLGWWLFPQPPLISPAPGEGYGLSRVPQTERTPPHVVGFKVENVLFVLVHLYYKPCHNLENYFDVTVIIKAQFICINIILPFLRFNSL